MTKAFRDKIIAKAEELGWNCTASDENEWEFYQMSPAGEDFGVCLYDEDDIVSAFDWDIPCGYITFGTCGMSIAKIIKKKWMRKFVNDWRNKTYKQVNDEIRQQEWEAM